MAYRVIFAPLAEADIDEIVAYIARDNREAAYRVGRELLTTAHALAHNPRIGIVLRRRNVRYTVHYPYQIFYRVDDEAKVIEVLRFWHGARNPRKLRF